MIWYQSEDLNDPYVLINDETHTLIGRVRYDPDQDMGHRYRAWLPQFGTVSGHATASAAKEAVVAKWYKALHA